MGATTGPYASPGPTNGPYSGPRSDARSIAAGLRALADALEDGRRPVPARGFGLRRVNTSPVVPAVIHDALCGWRVATPQGEDGEPDSDVMSCAGCGLSYPRDEVGPNARPLTGESHG